LVKRKIKMTGYWIAYDKTVMVVDQNDFNSGSLVKKIIADPTGDWSGSVGQSPHLYSGHFVISQDEVIRLIFGD
jgi:hypothetical protein